MGVISSKTAHFVPTATIGNTVRGVELAIASEPYIKSHNGQFLKKSTQLGKN